jgi:hypothetical protein
MSQSLADVFDAVAHKRLVQVDLPSRGSNQHELNGSVALREFFKTAEKVEGSLEWHYFVDDKEPEYEEGTFTFYDARARSAQRTGRTEWRFYYSGSFLSRCSEGDELILVRTRAGACHALVFRTGSAWLRAARHLFAIKDSCDRLDLLPAAAISKLELALVRRQILEALELELDVASSGTDMELMERTFGRKFPKTKDMSAFARTQVEVDPLAADNALMQWVDREEQLFRALEAVIIGERIAKGFDSVDDFIQFSLSVQNRRKSRMGHALQNHLFEIFSLAGLRFQEQVKTENGNRPDFIFPGALEYHDTGYDPSHLFMLGVKSSAKDRWRQVISEADRVIVKHLCTLQPGISAKQMNQMAARQVHLVVPAGLHETYALAQCPMILDIEGFIALVRDAQQG